MFTRLLLIHLNKHLLMNLRPVFGIKRGVYPKTIALFMSGLVKLNLVKEAESLKKILLLLGQHFKRFFVQIKCFLAMEEQ